MRMKGKKIKAPKLPSKGSDKRLRYNLGTKNLTNEQRK